MKLSNSRFDCYHRCPYKHYLSYYEGLKSKRKDRPLYFGSDIHKLLQYRYNPRKLEKAMIEIGDTYYALSPQQHAQLGESYIEDLSSIFNDYCKVYRNAPIPKHTEKEFRIHVGDYKGERIIFHGIIDEIYRGQTVDLGEHKSFGRKPDLNTLVMNTQSSLYAKAYFFKTGKLPDRVIWDYIRSTPAQMPEYLEKTGRFSLARKNTITPYSFLRACDMHGITDRNIRAQRSIFNPNIGDYFFRHPMDIVPTKVDIVWDGFIYTARDIIRQGHKNKTRYLTRDCCWCDYRDICNAELSGNSAQGIIDRDFRYRNEEE